MNQLSNINITVLDEKEFKEDNRIIKHLIEIVKPNYVAPGFLLAKEIARCNSLYLAEIDNVIAAFFMVAWEYLNVQAEVIPTVYLGLSATSQAAQGNKLVYRLMQQFIKDAQAWEDKHNKQLLIWYTTATPIFYNTLNDLFEHHQPYTDGTYSQNYANLAYAIRMKMGWHAPLTMHPFRLAGAQAGTHYSESERIAKISDKYSHTLFTNLAIDETKGDRLLCLCRIPKYNCSSLQI